MHVRTNSPFYRLSLPALNLASLLFKTVSLIHSTCKARRQKKFPQLFIISVDSLSFGGTGKTPLVMAIGQALEKRSVPFAIVSRGYRSAHEKNGALVEPTHRADEVGDEPWLLKKYFPGQDVFVGRDRLRSIAAAADRKNRFVILDDGLQTSQVKKDFSIMLVNPGHPYFYLRHFKFMKRREHLVLYYQRGERQGTELRPGTYSFTTRDFLDKRDRPVDIAHAKIIAFSALGDNSRFKNDLDGFHVQAFREFPDHHAFTPSDIQDLDGLRRDKNAAWMVCTEKDFCKLKDCLDATIPLIYSRNKIELPGHAIEQIIAHAAEKGFF